jgi:poly-gamma-glutamate capsule biosynthesis protein CapA/YwtB (metallophosphatase superfamily)
MAVYGIAAVLAVLAFALIWQNSRSGEEEVAAEVQGESTDNEAGTGTDATPDISTTDSTTTTAPPPPEPITLAFAGDTNYESVAGSAADRIRPFQELLSSADFAVVNLETAITERGTPVGKEFTFRAPPSVLAGLQENGVDAVSMANNHGMDFGSVGLVDSLEAKKTSPIPVLGIGANEDEAFAPHVVEVKGHTVSIIAATQVLDASLQSSWTATESQGGLASAKREDRLVEEVVKARAASDIVVVFLHWGVERTTCPSESQQSLADTLREAGADVIVGSHAHRVLAGGRLGDAVVHYGLGNFGFYAQGAEASTTGVFTVTLSGRRAESYQWHPGVIRERVPQPLTGADGLEAVAAWDQLRDCSNLTP